MDRSACLSKGHLTTARTVARPPSWPVCEKCRRHLEGYHGRPVQRLSICCVVTRDFSCVRAQQSQPKSPRKCLSFPHVRVVSSLGSSCSEWQDGQAFISHRETQFRSHLQQLRGLGQPGTGRSHISPRENRMPAGCQKSVAMHMLRPTERHARKNRAEHRWFPLNAATISTT